MLASKVDLAPPSSLTEEGLQSLRAMSATKVLNFSKMPDLFYSLPPDVQQEEQATRPAGLSSPPLRLDSHTLPDTVSDVLLVVACRC